MQPLRKDFRGEIWTNIHPDLLNSIIGINGEPVDDNTGKDAHSQNAIALMQKNFKEPIYATFTINGTAANIMAMKSMLDRWSSIVCAEQTHINTYECGAFEYMLGNKILSAETVDGKLTPEIVSQLLKAKKKLKFQPKVIAITQPTEYGTLYTAQELKELCDFAHGLSMYVYIDGARLGNALVALHLTLKEMIEDTGIDAFSFGATKAGALFGELVVFRRKEFARCLEYSQKQSLQHLDKSKFLGVQMEYLLQSGLYLENAEKSNAAAKYLERKLTEKGLKIFYPVQTNMVFCVIEPERLEKITKKYDLHYWDEFTHVVRLAATYLTTKEAIDEFAELF